eukprot:scaffold9.g3092.t1
MPMPSLFRRNGAEDADLHSRARAEVGGRNKESTEHYEGARRKGLNIVACGWGMRHLKEGDEILMTVAEHHSQLAPWQQVAGKPVAALSRGAARPASPPAGGKTGAKIVDVGLTHDTEEVDMEDFEKKLSPRTKASTARTRARACTRGSVVVMVHLSNVLGCVLDAQRVCERAHQAGPAGLQGRVPIVGALVLLDSCQFVPHRPTDVQALGCDWLVASGHKTYEVLNEMEPLIVGGSTAGEIHYGMHTDVPPPLRFEAGTPAIAEAIGLGEAVDYLSAVGMKEIHRHETELAHLLYSELRSVPGIRILGPPPCPNDYLKIGSTMRASAYIYMTQEEICAFVEALRECVALRWGGA